MEEQKPVSLRTVGILVAVCAAMIMFSNGMGVLAFTSLIEGDYPIRFPENSEFNLFH
jgi:ABC-type microcin C transport system permease subunit YejB